MRVFGLALLVDASLTASANQALEKQRGHRAAARGDAAGAGHPQGERPIPSLLPLKKLERLIDKGYLRSSEIDTYTMDALEALSGDLADCAVQRFSEANFGRITNKSGFLMGIIRRVQTEGPDKGGADLDELSRSVRYRLKDLMDEGRLKREDIDARMIKALSDLPSDLGLEAVDKFAAANLDNVRSKTGFMMGIIKRIDQDLRGGGPGFRPGGPMRGGPAYAPPPPAYGAYGSYSDYRGGDYRADYRGDYGYGGGYRDRY